MYASSGIVSATSFSGDGSNLTNVGGSIVNIDSTVIAEAPKILPYVPAMKIAVAQALYISPDQIGIKATTNERIGFLGREEGMAAMAVAGVNMPN